MVFQGFGSLQLVQHVCHLFTKVLMGQVSGRREDDEQHRPGRQWETGSSTLVEQTTDAPSDPIADDCAPNFPRNRVCHPKGVIVSGFVEVSESQIRRSNAGAVGTQTGKRRPIGDAPDQAAIL